MTGGIKSHLTFFEQINCRVSLDVKFVPLSLNIDDAVPLQLKNLDKPLIETGESCSGTNSNHISHVDEPVIKNTHAL